MASEDAYEVDIALPLELTVLGALGQLIGGAFPGAVTYFGQDAPPDHMRISIPRSEVEDYLHEEDDEMYGPT